MKKSIIISTRSNTKLSTQIANNLGMSLTKVKIKDFPDSEIYVEIKENIRLEEVFIIAGFKSGVGSNRNNDIMELMLLIDAVRRSNPSVINVIFPYYAYARQDRRTNRSPISGKVFANMLCHSGIDSVICMDLHSLQTQAFFNNNVVCEHISALKTMRDSIVGAIVPFYWDVVVAADVGGTGRARYFAKELNLPIAIIDKRRPEQGMSVVMNVIGDVKGKKCVIVDDMIDGGGTLVSAVEALKLAGSLSVDCVAVHGVFSGKSIERIEQSDIGTLYITDSIEHTSELTSKIRVISVKDLVSETIRRFRNGESLKALVS